MSPTVTKPRTKTRTKTQRPPLYKVILLNDDFTPREFVVQVLKAVFRMNAERADVVATPHIAGLTPDAIEHQAFDTVNQVKELLAGRVPPGAVNADAAHRLSRLRR